MSVQDAQGATFAATVTDASPTQVNFLVPRGAANGPAKVTVTSDTGASFTGAVEVVPVAPSVFVATLTRVHADGSQSLEYVTGPIDLGVAAGDRVYLTLSGTGFKNASSAKVLFGAVAGDVSFAGATVTDGLEQVNVLIPSVLDGTNASVDVRLLAAGLRANVALLAIR